MDFKVSSVDLLSLTFKYKYNALCAGHERGCHGVGGRGNNPELPGLGGREPRNLLVDAARGAPSTLSGRVSSPSNVSEGLRKKIQSEKCPDFSVFIRVAPDTDLAGYITNIFAGYPVSG